ncbi:PD-(D/E)XK nuclease-like domain-containing protein [Atlantibacter hermannii]|uniref:PD-(D/E)XK nuclease-like domain-containing protein n=1 Tax=Atlantibacter hermannii TaxID=565 RepID=UPI0013EF39C2|nr:PD-(D/E)XK nuclease-like domain-containing protein [Atlantibacter hermannii]
MNTYAFLIKAKAKSGAKNLFCWFSAKSDSRAQREIENILEDAEIEVGRGADYQLPARTNWLVVDDLPAERVLDDTWCDHYELGEDGKSWSQISKAEDSVNIQDERAQLEETAGDNESGLQERAASHQSYTFEQRVLGTWLFGMFDELSTEQKGEITRLSMDMDATYPQNVLLACRSHDLRQLQHVFPETLADLLAETKSVWPLDGKAPQLAHLVGFFGEWINAHNNACDTGGHGNHQVRSDVTAKWQKKSGTVVTQRTDVGTNAGGGIVTDRSQDYTHTLDTLDYEIAAATLPMDFDIYNLPVSIHRRAREIIEKKESPFREWSAALRKTAGILDYSRAAIFALIRGAAENVHHFPVSLQTYISANLKEHQHDKPDAATVEAAQFSRETLDKQLAADRGEYVEGISDPSDPKWDKTPRKTFCTHEENLQRVREEGARRRADEAAAQPKVENLGAGVFSIEGLTGNAPINPDNGPVMGDATYQEMAEGLREELEVTEDVQMETAVSNEIPAGTPVSTGESADEDHPQADAVNAAGIFAANAPRLANHTEPETNQESVKPDQSEPAPQQSEPSSPETEPEATEYPAFFEPGRYEGLPNNVYHAANGISSTMVKDARVSLMYFNARHVEKTISREQSKVLDMGNLVHALALQPENLHAEFSIEPEIPQGAFTTTATLRAFIDEHNASLPALLSADDIKALLEEHNATLTDPVPLGGSLEETAQSYMALPAEYQRIEPDQKQTAVAMKACIKEYNATLPAPVKTSGGRDALLEQLAIVNPDLVAQEAQKPQPLKVSGTKADLIQSVKSVKPVAVFADELLDAWRENPDGKILVTRQQLATALAIQSALLAHPTAGKFLTHSGRAVEVSYFGIDEETGLEIRVRPDLEIDMNGIRIGADLKTISMWNIKQSALRARLHREIIDRDYHLSAAMYTETAALDQFFWIFVNKDEGYHWIAIVEASQELLELGALEYRTTMGAIANAFDTGEWPAPIIDDYTDELSDYDMRRLEALRSLANV